MRFRSAPTYCLHGISRIENQTFRRREVSNVLLRALVSVVIIRPVIAVSAAVWHTVEHGTQNANRQAIDDVQLRRGKLAIRYAWPEDDQHAPGGRAKCISIDPSYEGRRVDDDYLELLSRGEEKRGHAVGNEQLGSAISLRPGGKQKEIGKRSCSNRALNSSCGAKIVDQSRRRRDTEGGVLCSAANVSIDEESSIARACKRDREVGGDERFAVTRSGARDAQRNRPAAGEVIPDGEVQRSERLDCLR